jgi:hypothetical protein
VRFELTGVPDVKNRESNGNVIFNDFSDFNYDGVSIGNTFEAQGANFQYVSLNADGSGTYKSFALRSDGNIIGGTTIDNKRIVMNTARADLDTERDRTHEIFHTLFFDRDNASFGIGSYIRRNDMPNQEDINALINNPELPRK